MSVFGKLDAESVSSNPFKVERGVYSGEVTRLEFRTTANNLKQLFLEVVIADEESDYDGERVNKYYFLPDEDMDQQMLDDLPLEEKKRVKRNIATLKKDLCGAEGNDKQIGLAVDANDLNDPDWDPKSLVGTPVMIGVNVYKDKSQIQWINKREE